MERGRQHAIDTATPGSDERYHDVSSGTCSVCGGTTMSIPVVHLPRSGMRQYQKAPRMIQDAPVPESALENRASA
eukprot:2650366-Rhodomonas_salina.1